MRARRLVLTLVGLGAGLLVLGGVLLASLPYIVDLPRIQGMLRAEASHLLDRPVRFERVSLGYLPLPAIHVRGFTVANAPDFGADPLLEVDDARVRVRLLPLLRGRLQFGEVTLVRPRVVLEQRPDGTWNLPAPGSSRPTPAAPFVLVSRVRLQDGRVEVRVAGPPGGPAAAHLVDRIDVTLDDLGWSEPIRFHLAARLPGGGVSLTVDGHVGPLATARSDLAAVPARLAARFIAEESRGTPESGFTLAGKGAGELRAEGTLGNMVGGGRLDFARLVIGHRPVACAGRPAHPLVLESVELPVQITGPTLTVEPFALRVAGGAIRGSATLTWRAGVPAVRLAGVRFQGVAAEPVLVDFLCQPYAVTGRVDATVDATFSGTGSDLLQSARGTWQFQVGPGRLVGPAALTLLSGAVRVGSALYSVVTLDAPAGAFASPVEFDSLSATGAVGGAQLRVRQVAMQGRQLRLTGSGTYGLVDTRLDFDLQVQSGKAAFGVKIAGTAGEPSYQSTARGLLGRLTDVLGNAWPSARKPSPAAGQPATR